MNSWRTHILMLVLSGLISLGVRAQPTSVVNGPHNLSSGGPGPVRASTESEVCIFCHISHNASPERALWNRSLTPQAFTVYTSRALQAKPGQPTGTSKMCLSCHDGTIALGSVLSRQTPIAMAGGVTTMPSGSSNLGTDLRDDHPISFRFDSTVAAKSGKLRDPGGLPHAVKLDSNRELQCTSCHDAHNNAFGKFLVMRNTNSELCVSCHQTGRTDIAGHAQCNDCHQSHSSPSGPYLLRKQTITQTCVRCHDGQTARAANIAGELHKLSVHDTASPVDPPGAMTDVATCTSCHEPHTMMRGVASTSTAAPGPVPLSKARLGQVAGVNASGSPVKVAASEQEVCFKCHAEGNKRPTAVPRRHSQNNTRLQFSPSAISLHPVGTPGRSVQVPSLKPGWSTASTMSCSDCHGSDTGQTAGVHGSSFRSLLVARYETADRLSESATSYALCYKCHDRGSILGDRSFQGHRLHVVDQRTSCAACHDSHGIPAGQGSATGNTHLINFASDVVFPDRVTGRLEYRDTGGFTGECFLSCHGVDHSPKRYPSAIKSNGVPRAAPPARLH